MEEWRTNPINGWRGKVVATRTCRQRSHRLGKISGCKPSHSQIRVKYADMPPTAKAACGTDTFWEMAIRMRRG